MLEAVDFSFACLDRKRNMMKNNLREKSAKVFELSV